MKNNMNKLKNNYLNVPKIKTERLILNNPLENDFESLQVFLKSEKSKFIGGPYTSFTSWTDYMANIGHWSLYGYGLWSVRIKNNDKFIGRVGIINIPKFNAPDLAWQLFEGYEGKGYAYEAATSVRDFAIEKYNFSSLASHIMGGNDKSLLLAEKIGPKSKKEEVIMNKKFIIYNHI